MTQLTPPSAVDAILQRALQDPDYADLLFADPQRALAGWELTPQDSAALRSLRREDLARLGAMASAATEAVLSQEDLHSVAAGAAAAAGGPLGVRPWAIGPLGAGPSGGLGGRQHNETALWI